MAYSNNSSFTSLCPAAVSTYATLHLDTILKVLNHLIALNLLAEVFLLLNSFSVSYLEFMGFNTVLCSFALGCVSVVVGLILNNNRISALSVLSPTEYMLGIGTGITMGAAVLAGMLSSAYNTTLDCESETTSSTIAPATNTTDPSTRHPDPSLHDACATHAASMNSIWFWAGLSAWLHVISAMLLVLGRHELSSSEIYESVPTTTTAAPQLDFEETFRRQQQQILGVQQASFLQSRANAMFTGDYATIPEVTQGNSQRAAPSHQVV